MKQFIHSVLLDIETELNEEFNMNFRRKAFFDKPWPATRLNNNRGSMMMRSGNLRRSIRSEVHGSSIRFSSSLPYASIHNEGGIITVTAQMKKFFWAMYYKTSGAVKGKSQRDILLSTEAQQWKNLALMKTGQKIKIEKRQFIGWHPSLHHRIETISGKHLDEVSKLIHDKLTRK